MAQTLNYFVEFPDYIDIRSADKLNTFLLYYGFPSIIELKKANSTSVVKGPLFVNLNTEELTFITYF